MYDYISGFNRKNDDGTSTPVSGRLDLFRNFNEHGDAFARPYPPYGIKFNSNFQWSTTSRDVKDGNVNHITREPEQVKAFRDTWRDGIHSYLTYLRDRLMAARDLLKESGSIFVQIGDENVHRVRAVMDEVFGDENFLGEIYATKTGSQTGNFLAADEMYRVLKPGGKMATSVWAEPNKNIWISGIVSVINRNMQLPPPLAGAPGMFRCAAPGFIKSILEKSGFTNVKEQEVKGKTVYKDFDNLWQTMNEVAAPVVGALSKADDNMKQKIKSEVQQLCRQYITDKGLELDYSSWVISGSK